MSNCIFCQIVQKKIKSNIVYEDKEIVAFRDINPQAPVHILIVPKKHIEKVLDMSSEDELLIGKIYTTLKQIAKSESTAETGFRIVVNCGLDAGQEVQHLHFHLLGGRKFSWPPG
ncbi:MAG: histidine triad nucleotide-binding protein [Elusimicrobiota bacterium]|nr:histidine triad nucleotide-binding protein [Elusimicrobiota bacterium]